ncbi:MAG: glycosyltransferase family 4 protein [Marinilabiliales bacterium]|nr:glycosyltransferase family 4 protein [Marinilabiliales bacterium]
MKKVLIITYYWPPSGGAGVQRWLKFTQYLPEFGVEPFVLTVDEKAASYAQKDPSLLSEIDSNLSVYKTPTSEPYGFYRKLSGKNEIPYGGFSNRKKITMFDRFSRFLRGNLFLPDPRKGWSKYALPKALELIDSLQIDTVITSGPPHSSHLIGLRLKQIRKIRWMVDFRDPWTDIYYYKELLHTLPARLYDLSLEKKVLTSADFLITVSDHLAELLVDKYPILKDRCKVIPNGYDERDFLELPVLSNPKFTITYTGTISLSYRIQGFIEAVSLLPAAMKEDVCIRFVGSVPNEVGMQFKDLDLEHLVEVVGYLPHRDAISQMAGASLLLLAIPDAPGNKGIVTGKFFEYLASGRPILAIGPKGGDVEGMLRKAQAGEFFDYDEVKEMAHYMEMCYNRSKTGDLKNQNSGINCYTRKNLTAELTKSIG